MIWVANDHAGVELKKIIIGELKNMGLECRDIGTNDTSPSDYPSYAQKVAQKVKANPQELGILICKSGQGMAIAANRFNGIRASVVWNSEIARETREDNDSNVLSLPAGYIDGGEAVSILRAWLQTPFSTAERHRRRVNQIDNR